MNTSPEAQPGEVQLRKLDSPLGPLLVGATEAGICLCEFAERGGEERIVARLEQRLGRRVGAPETGGEPPEGSSPQDRLLGLLEAQLADYFAGTLRTFDLPLDLAGTPWQRRVWSALLEIPYGATTSYGGLAARLGKPGGSRAVGRANGENPVAIAVPCHRVIQADGGLRGYGGGLHRKRWLLDLEAGALQLGL
jgi:AraC family transcriptional regulator of adaptative response/methylated-DNA-[protein]-cysteine methyltransferase